MGYIPSFLKSSTPYSITLTPGVLSAPVSLSPNVIQANSHPVLYAITTDSVGDGVGNSDMAAEGYITLDSASQATAHRSIDNLGTTTTTFFFYIVEVLGIFVGGSKSMPASAGKAEPGATGQLPVNYQTGWQYNGSTYK